MDKELHFHRCFVRTNHVPKIVKREPVATLNGLLLFVQEAIAYVLSFRGITDWVPLTSIEELRATIPKQIYFHEYIGLAINHQCVVDDAFRYAEEDGFVEDVWLKLPADEAREKAKRYLEVVKAKTTPVNLSFFHMLAFATYLSRISILGGRTDLVTVIIWKVIHVFAECFPFEWIYYDARQWAMAYIARHFEIHNKLIEEDPFQESKPTYSQFAEP